MDKYITIKHCNNNKINPKIFTKNVLLYNKKYYEDKINNIIKIQKWIKNIYIKIKNIINIITIIDLIILNIKKNNKKHNDLFIKCYKILKKYNPAKNEYKFIYGVLIQKSVIDLLKQIFYDCIDLDLLCKNGSQYKNDCKLNITKYLCLDISIKSKKNKKGNVIIINKNSNNKQYNLNNLITIIVLIELKDIIIIPHNIIPEKYIQNNDSNISYKSSLFTLLYKHIEYKKYIIDLKSNNDFNIFYKNIYPYINNHNIYDELYNKL